MLVLDFEGFGSDENHRGRVSHKEHKEVAALACHDAKNIEFQSSASSGIMHEMHGFCLSIK